LPLKHKGQWHTTFIKVHPSGLKRLTTMEDVK
jgi:hypothetical protein